MAITASGLFGLTWQNMFIDTAGQSMEAETHKGMLVQDGYTPNFSTHDFRNDVTNEVSGTGYTAGGQAMTSTDWTISSGTLTFDAADNAWATSTITDAMAHIFYFNVGASSTDQLLLLQDFVTAVSTSAGTLTVQHNASGIVVFDFTPA